MTKNVIKSMPLRKKMILVFCLPTILLFMVNMTLYMGTNRMLNSLDAVYASNNSLNDLSEALDVLQNSTGGYLGTKTSDALEQYYIAEQDFADILDKFDANKDDNEGRVLERNIRIMSANYITLTSQAVESKRGGNVEKYKNYYDTATRLYNYIDTNITSLNNQQFVNNSKSYSAMMGTLQTIEELNILTLILIGMANLSFVVLIASTITEPLIMLADAAN